MSFEGNTWILTYVVAKERFIRLKVLMTVASCNIEHVFHGFRGKQAVEVRFIQSLGSRREEMEHDRKKYDERRHGWSSERRMAVRSRCGALKLVDTGDEGCPTACTLVSLTKRAN